MQTCPPSLAPSLLEVCSKRALDFMGTTDICLHEETNCVTLLCFFFLRKSNQCHEEQNADVLPLRAAYRAGRQQAGFSCFLLLLLVYTADQEVPTDGAGTG